MSSNNGVLHTRIGRHMKRRLEAEAERRGVELSALVRAILQVHCEDVGDEILGWQEADQAIVQLVRVQHVEVVIPRRFLIRR